MSHWITFLKKKLHTLLKFLTKNNKSPQFFTNKTLLSGLIQLLICWGLSGFFILPSATTAIVTRLGDYQRLVGPGIHWHLRFVEKAFKLEVGKTYHQVSNVSAFTSDANLVNATLDVSYSIKDARSFVFGMHNAKQYFVNSIISSLQKAVSRYPLANLFDNKTKLLIQKELKQALQKEVAQYPLGIHLVDIALPMLNPPFELKKDFKELKRAIQEANILESNAQSKVKQLEHKIELKTQSLNARAYARKHELINKAKIETRRFLALLPYYKKRPELTLQRLQCEKTEKILKNSKKILLTQPKGKSARDIIPVQLSLDKSLLKVKEDKTLTKENHHAA